MDIYVGYSNKVVCCLFGSWFVVRRVVGVFVIVSVDKRAQHRSFLIVDQFIFINKI